MELKEGEVIYKFCICGVRKMYVKENDGLFVKLVETKKKKPLKMRFPIKHLELNFIGHTHEECVKNTLAEIKRLADVKLYNLSNVE